MPYMNVSTCGLNCMECDLYKLLNDRSIQEKMIPYFWEQTLIRSMQVSELLP